MPRPLQISERRKNLGIAAFAGLLEIPVILLMFGWSLPMPARFGVLAHLFAAGLMFFAPPRDRNLWSKTRHWGESLGLMTLMLPGFGWGISFWLLWFGEEAPKNKDAYRFEDENEESFDPEEVFMLGTSNGPSPTVRTEKVDVYPAVDALLSGKPGLQRGAVETLARIQTPEAIRWLKKVRAEFAPEVRFYATTALTRLKHEFETAIQAAEREVFKKPADPGPKITFQRVRYEYAVSGILEGDLRRIMLEECREQVEKILEGLRRGESKKGHELDADYLLYRIERELDPDRALEILAELERLQPVSATRWQRERAELLFSLSRYDEVLKVSREQYEVIAGSGRPEDEAWTGALLWWKDDRY